MKLIDKVWLACAIDSEGTIGYYRREREAEEGTGETRGIRFGGR